MASWLQSIFDGIADIPTLLVWLFIFLSAFTEMVFPAYPGHTILLFGGCLAGMGLHGPGTILYLSYLVGTFLGAMILFELGLRYGRRILAFRFIQRFFNVEKQAHTAQLSKRYGLWSLLLCKFIPGIGSISILLYGIFSNDKNLPKPELRQARRHGWLGIVLSATLHTTALFLIGRSIGYSWDGITGFMRMYDHAARAFFIIIIALFIIIKIILKLYKNKKERASS